jgi:hypothetical protein
MLAPGACRCGLAITFQHTHAEPAPGRSFSLPLPSRPAWAWTNPILRGLTAVGARYCDRCRLTKARAWRLSSAPHSSCCPPESLSCVAGRGIWWEWSRAVDELLKILVKVPVVPSLSSGRTDRQARRRGLDWFFIPSSPASLAACIFFATRALLYAAGEWRLLAFAFAHHLPGRPETTLSFFIPSLSPFPSLAGRALGSRTLRQGTPDTHC